MGIMLSSCATVNRAAIILGETKFPQVTDPHSAPSPTPVVDTLPTAGVKMENLTFKCKNCDAREADIIAKMQIKANAVIKTQCFADHFILTKFRSDLIQTNGLTREQVVDKIKNTVIHDIPIEMYDGRKGVYGYTYPNSPTIYLNRYYRSQYDYNMKYWSIDAEVSNAVHEATHKMGFDHDYRSTSRRPYSVPYSANYAVDECIHELQ